MKWDPATAPEMRTGELGTDRRYTGQRWESSVVLYDYNARFYDPVVARFIQADTIVPELGNPQAFNRHAYTLGNPLIYVDPTGNNPIPLILILSFLLTVPSSDYQAPNYPENSPSPLECAGPLASCFGSEVLLEDFRQGYDEQNPVPSQEFHALLDKVAEDLYTHDVTSPGYVSGRGTYDTPFYNGGGRGAPTLEGEYDATQQICIQGLRCSGRSEINYFAQGMWSAAAGESLETAIFITKTWKAVSYKGEKPSEDTLYWLEYGYYYYFEWLGSQEKSDDPE